LLARSIGYPSVEQSILAEFSIGFLADDRELAPLKRQWRVGTARKRRRPIDVRQQLGVRCVRNVVNSEPAIALRGIATVARDDHVMQRVTFALWRRIDFAGRAIHAR
jgi:hypothetical protein